MRIWNKDKAPDKDGTYMVMRADNLIVETAYTDGAWTSGLDVKYWAELKEDTDLTDWDKVPIDTPLLVYQEEAGWCRRHFAYHDGSTIYTWANGLTSWTAESYDGVSKTVSAWNVCFEEGESND